MSNYIVREGPGEFRLDIYACRCHYCNSVFTGSGATPTWMGLYCCPGCMSVFQGLSAVNPVTQPTEYKSDVKGWE
jgi:hypothetical protein